MLELRHQQKTAQNCCAVGVRMLHHGIGIRRLYMSYVLRGTDRQQESALYEFENCGPGSSQITSSDTFLYEDRSEGP